MARVANRGIRWTGLVLLVMGVGWLAAGEMRAQGAAPGGIPSFEVDPS